MENNQTSRDPHGNRPLNRNIKSIAQYSRRYWTIFLQIFQKFALCFFLDIFACVQRENRRPQRDESKEKRIFFKLKMHRTLMHKKKRLRQAKKYIRRKIPSRN